MQMNINFFFSMNVSLDDLDRGTKEADCKPLGDGQEAVILMSTQQSHFPLDESDDAKLFPHDSELESLGDSPDSKDVVHADDQVQLVLSYVFVI